MARSGTGVRPRADLMLLTYQFECILVEVVDELLYIGSLSFVTWYLDNIICVLRIVRKPILPQHLEVGVMGLIG